jgi:hypothetical protein
VHKYIPKKASDWLAPIAFGLGVIAIIVARTAGHSLSDNNCLAAYWTQHIQDVAFGLATMSVLGAFLNASFRIKSGNKATNITTGLVTVVCAILAYVSWLMATNCIAPSV